MIGSKKLLKSWAIPNRGSEKMGVSARLEFSTYAKLHALKATFPNRSVNDLINDILENGLDEIINELGEPHGKTTEYIEEVGGMVDISPNTAYRFNSEYLRIMDNVDKSDTSKVTKEEATKEDKK